MATKRRNRVFLALLLIVVSISLVSGCDRYTKHKVLTFFFTGVPPLEGETRKGEWDGQEQKGAGKAKKQVKFVMSAHSFFVSKKCTKCHQTAVTRSFRVPGQQVSLGSQRLPEINFAKKKGELRVPLKEICVNCHVNRSASFAIENGLWLHAPVNKANCTICHHQHQSTNKFLLREKPEKLCVRCHSEGLINMTKDHSEVKNCLQCHNPHLGKNKYLLVKDYKEITQLPDPNADFPDR